MTTNRSAGIRPKLPKDHGGELQFNFVAPLIISPHDSKTLYEAGNYVFKSSDRGDHWNVISPNIADSQDERRDSLAAGAIAESPLEPGLIYAGTDRGAMWVTADGGENWSERSENFPVAYVRSICPSRFSATRAYVAASGLNYDDFQTHLSCTEDRGVTWKSISANLPGEPANVILEDPVHEEILYAGLFRGVYISIDRGESWSLLGRNLPNCSVADLAIQEREQDLVIGTHGRGIYKMSLAPIYEYFENRSKIEIKNHLFPIPTAKLPYLSDINPTLNFNRVEKVPITFWLTEAGEVTISVFESGEGQPAKKTAGEEATEGKSTGKGNQKAFPKPLTSFVVSGERGFNQFRWDLVLRSNQSDAPYFINYKEYLKIGKYRLQMKTLEKTAWEHAFEVVGDPNEK